MYQGNSSINHPDPVYPSAFIGFDSALEAVWPLIVSRIGFPGTFSRQNQNQSRNRAKQFGIRIYDWGSNDGDEMTAAFELALVLLSSTFPQFTPIPVLLVCLDLGALVEWLPLPYFPRVLVLCKARYCCLPKKA